jgi:hypothetical protein
MPWGPVCITFPHVLAGTAVTVCATEKRKQRVGLTDAIQYPHGQHQGQAQAGVRCGTDTTLPSKWCDKGTRRRQPTGNRLGGASTIAGRCNNATAYTGSATGRCQCAATTVDLDLRLLTLLNITAPAEAAPFTTEGASPLRRPLAVHLLLQYTSSTAWVKG